VRGAEDGTNTEGEITMVFKAKIICAVCAAALLLIALCACGTQNVTNTAEFILASNEDMSEETSKELGKLTDAFLTALSTAEVDGLMEHMDEAFLAGSATKATIRNFFEGVKENNANPFVLYDSYYLKGLTVSDTMVKVKKSESDTQYAELTPGSEEMYAAMFASDNEKISQMVVMLCAKTENTWKIVWIDASDYKYNGKTGEDLYRIAKEFQQKGELMPAYLTSEMMFNTFTPGKLLRYGEFDQMEDFYYQIQSEVWKERKLPFVLDKVSDKLKLFVVGLANEKDWGVIPMIMYQTGTDIADKQAVHEEGRKVIDAFDALYPGVKENFAAIKLHATNEDPSASEKPVDMESFVLPTK
jgi:hypothetical protein